VGGDYLFFSAYEKETQMTYVSDKSRKSFIADKLSKMPPFKIYEKGDIAHIIEMGNVFWMSLKRGQRIHLFPVKRVPECI